MVNHQTSPDSALLPLELRSAAYTLTDLEVAVFPSLLPALLIANVLSPVVWRWRDDPWFAGIEALSPYRRVLRVKQFIMDRYAFNLDLMTWGLTTQNAETERFAPHIPQSELCRLSPFLECEGDRHYFEMGIRKHFGLDAYPDEVIPYWKTETVEAMEAFRHVRPDGKGAGECVSLMALYGAALFVVARLPLDQFWMIVTPLHAQGFVELDGCLLLTNNRRVVTQRMWFNGTRLGLRARRALEHERASAVANVDGCVGALGSTLDPARYRRFRSLLDGFTSVDRIRGEHLIGFLRSRPDLQPLFQLLGRHGYVALEAAMAAEADSPHRLEERSRNRLLALLADPASKSLPGRVPLRVVEDQLACNVLSPTDPACAAALPQLSREAVEDLQRHCHVTSVLPVASSGSVATRLELEGFSNPRAMLEHVRTQEATNPIARLALHVHRDVGVTGLEAFLHAAVSRNPVCVEVTRHLGLPEIAELLRRLPNTSIYEGGCRLAQPDEVWNFGRGDGAEKAILFGALLRQREPAATIQLEISSDRVFVRVNSRRVAFDSSKQLPQGRWPIPAA